MNLDTILSVAAVVLFVLAACNIQTGRLTAAGLACWAATLIL